MSFYSLIYSSVVLSVSKHFFTSFFYARSTDVSSLAEDSFSSINWLSEPILNWVFSIESLYDSDLLLLSFPLVALILSSTLPSSFGYKMWVISLIAWKFAQNLLLHWEVTMKTYLPPESFLSARSSSESCRWTFFLIWSTTKDL